jgi:polar amino acid transport system substrate-binding protein
LLISKGYQVEINFLPWARAVRSVELGNTDILFPEYYIEDSAPSDYVKGKRRREVLMLSNEFPGGMIGFLKRKGEPDKFKGNLNNLKGAAIGVVRGYQNTPEFDAMMDNNEFNIVQAVDDLQLVKLLVAKRVDLIIGDPTVLRFTINYSDLPAVEKATLLNSIEQVKPAIKYNALYYALSAKNNNANTILKDINTGLYEFKNSGETQRIIDMGSSECY